MEGTEDQAHEKNGKLISWLGENSPLVAFSGGVDSTYLAFMASKYSPNYMAVTVASPLCPSWEMEEAPQVARELGLKHAIVSLDLLANPSVASNPEDRCYHCKRMILMKLSELAEREGLVVVDGTNADDLDVRRPGRRALAELGISSPLAEVGLVKDEVRRLSREMGLPTWNREPMPCLATRVPYGQELAADRLSRIDKAEEYVRSMGFRIVRIRDHGELARIELGEEELEGLDLEPFRRVVHQHLRDLGYRFVTLDLSGYSSGSWDQGS